MSDYSSLIEKLEERTARLSEAEAIIKKSYETLKALREVKSSYFSPSYIEIELQDYLEKWKLD